MQINYFLKNGQEKDIVEKRVERMQRKVEGSPNVETMLVAVRELRKEREKVKELQTQKTEQRTAIGMISLVKYIPSSNRHYITHCKKLYSW